MKLLRIIGIALIAIAIVCGAVYGSTYYFEYLHRTDTEAYIAKVDEAKEIEADAKKEYLANNAQITVPEEQNEESVLEDRPQKVRIVDNDVVCKLTIKACNIETLVYENDEDDYYLRRGADGKQSRHGEIYTNCYDCRVPIIYGHHMNDGTMFAGLDCAYIGAPVIVEDIGYLEDEVRHYSIISIKKDISAYDVYDYLADVEDGIVFITCSYGVDNGRLVVVATEDPAE